jgi:hypothetical protein
MNSHPIDLDRGNKLMTDFLLLRWAVAVLGSKSNNNWWPCDFLSEHGLAATEYNFQRSAFAAAVTSTAAAARLHHDEKIGKARVGHLFRFTFPMERAVHQILQTKSQEFTVKKPMAVIEELAEGEIDSPEGPVQVGKWDDIATRQGLVELARHYHAAFRSGRVILPYFAAVSR